MASIERSGNLDRRAETRATLSTAGGTTSVSSASQPSSSRSTTEKIPFEGQAIKIPRILASTLSRERTKGFGHLREERGGQSGRVASAPDSQRLVFRRQTAAASSVRRSILRGGTKSFTLRLKKQQCLTALTHPHHTSIIRITERPLFTFFSLPNNTAPYVP